MASVFKIFWVRMVIFLCLAPVVVLSVLRYTNENMLPEFKTFGIKLAFLICISPIFGFVFLSSAEAFEKAWKSNDRKKRWIALSLLFFGIAVIGGWLR